VTLAAIERRLKSRRGLLALWLAATGGAAVVALLMWRAGIPGWDDAAHVYKVFLLRRGGSIFWDDFWYGGGYGAVNYGFVFYLLALYVPAKLIVIVSAGTVPLFYFLYQRDMWGIDDVWPAWFLAGVMAAYLSHGQDPFVFALALTLGGLALLARRRPVLGALAVGVAVFANPMAFVVCGNFMLADLLARPAVRRRYLVFLCAVAPFAALRILSGLAFTEPGAYLNETPQLLLYLAFALMGLALAGVNAVHPRRPFFILFFVYAVTCVLSFVIPGSPLGNNIGRFFFVFGLPLLFLLRHTSLRRPFRYGDLAVVPIVLFGLLQFSTPYSHFTRHNEWPQTASRFFAPALAEARQLYDPNYRIHVVALRRHWEADYFPEAGMPITRGWYRQADAIHNSLFYTTYDEAAYVAWLRRMGVQYIFLPHAPLDVWSNHEARLLETSPAFEPVTRVGAWSVYRLRAAEPIVVGLEGGMADVLTMQRLWFTVRTDRPGSYLVKVSWSPYWTVRGGPGRLTPTPGRFMILHASRAGTYTLRFDVTLEKALAQAGARLGL
jgi:hypothetical protein